MVKPDSFVLGYPHCRRKPLVNENGVTFAIMERLAIAYPDSYVVVPIVKVGPLRTLSGRLLTLVMWELILE